MKLLISLLALLLCGATVASPISIVYVDKATEEKLGDFPISHVHYAKAIKVLARDHAPRLIVIKMFLDIPKPEDKILLEELKKHVNVYTQAYLDKDEAWIPSGEMFKAFAGVGFVNGRTNDKGEADGFFLTIKYQGKVWDSLPVLLTKKLRGKMPKVSPEKDGSIPLPPFPATTPWKTYSFLDLIEGKIKKGEFDGKVVFFFYNGKKAAPLPIVGAKLADQAQLVALLTDYLLTLP